MKFTSYDNTASFGADTLEILLENEAQNNLPISFIRNEHGYDTSDWLMATVRDDAGGVVLTAASTPPFNIVLYETGNKPNESALRLLRGDDLFFVPYWERSFQEECGVEVYDIPTNVSKIKKRAGKDTHFIWEDGNPVSQACTNRNTLNGGGINGVYTPPHYRGRGYASSVTAELSRILLERGNKFCFLFADAENPVSCGMYRKIGYYDLCVYDEIRFNK